MTRIEWIFATTVICAAIGFCALVVIYGERNTAELECARKTSPSQWCFEYTRALSQKAKP